jgi:hypothetical protein
MDIHKPKPVHSWRDFLTEIGIIVIGVTIALAGEQIVEAIHWRNVVDAQRQILKSVVEDNLGAVKARAVQQGCVDARLAQLKTVFERHAAGKPLQMKGPVGRPQNNSIGDEIWALAVQSEALNHMPLEERAGFAGAFSNFANLLALREDADRSWIDLAALDTPELLQEGDWVLLRHAYAQLIAKEARIKAVDAYVLQTQTAGVPVPNVTRKDALVAGYARAFCKPLI